jgi:hypothetical protein
MEMDGSPGVGPGDIGGAAPQAPGYAAVGIKQAMARRCLSCSRVRVTTGTGTGGLESMG